jgi:3-hydroxyisobutyrate dehydrogenase-like beta-hydroxyacid dehydrogenase
MTMALLTLPVGYPMARNLRAKIPVEDTLFVHDVNTAATQKFLDEHPQGVRVASNVREVAEKAVCVTLLPLLLL